MAVIAIALGIATIGTGIALKSEIQVTKQLTQARKDILSTANKAQAEVDKEKGLVKG